MTTPKTSFYLSNGSTLADIHPLENNGIDNLSVPLEITDIDWSAGTEATLVVNGDFTDRLVAVTRQLTVTAGSNQVSVVNTDGIYAGMFIHTSTSGIFKDYTYVVSVNHDTDAVTLSTTVTTGATNLDVTFCYPISIVDIDPTTPSPYVGSYGVVSSVITADTRKTRLTLSDLTPLKSARFDVVSVNAGTSGSWVIQGSLTSKDLFYSGAKFTIEDNTYGPANVEYTVAAALQSDVYTIIGLEKPTTGTGSVICVHGNVGVFFPVTTPPEQPQQLSVVQNTSHIVGTYPLLGHHDILDVEYIAGEDITKIHIGTTVSGTPVDASRSTADGLVKPTLTTTVITVDGLIDAGTIPDGTVVTSAPIKYGFVASPAITPTSPHVYIVSWRISGDHTNIFVPGTTVTVKNNNYFAFKRLLVDSSIFESGNPGVYPTGYTEIRTTINHAGSTMPVIDSTGEVVYPPPSIPYGHLQYTNLDVSSPLFLLGKGVSHYNSTVSWGTAIQSNMIHQLENFANDTPPTSPLKGQLWFNTTTPSLSVLTDDGWAGLVVSGLPVQGDINMNNYTINNLGDSTDPQSALNVRTGDDRYVNADGDVMTGTLDMTGNQIIGLSPTVGLDLSQAVSVEIGDDRYVNTDGDTMSGNLNMGLNRITHVQDPSESQDAATKAYVDSLSSGIVWLQSIADSSLFDDSLSSPPSIADQAMLVYRSYIVKPTAFDVTGVNDGLNIWSVSGDYVTTLSVNDKIEIINNTEVSANGFYTVSDVTYVSATNTTNVTVQETIPTTTTVSGKMLHATGAWTGKHGHVMAWNGQQWVDVLDRPVAIGDRFGVFFEVDNDESSIPTPGGSFGVSSQLGTVAQSAAGKIVTVNGRDSFHAVDWGVDVGSIYPPQEPVEPDAVSVLGANSPHYGHSYTFRGTWGDNVYSIDYKWIEFAGPSMLVDGAGLKYTGNILNVGQGTGVIVSANSVGISPTYFNTNYMRRDGSTAFTSTISMGNNRLVNLSNPINAADAVNKGYLDTNYISSTGSSVFSGNLDMGGYSITNLSYPVSASDAAPKAYVDTKVDKAGDTMTGQLVMSNPSGLAVIDMGNTNKIVNLADPTNARDAVNLQTADGRYVSKTGSIMTGPLTLHDDPTQPLHAATKIYVDTVVSTATIDGGSF